MWHQSLLELIGKTPMVKLARISANLKSTILVKIEYFNPGHSVKDRIGLKMVEDAERAGKLKAGGTIIEATSGNTGMGLAIVAAIKGYRCIFTIADKQSQEKIDALTALGAEVVVCPTNVAPEDPRSYYSVAERLSKQVPNSFYAHQYDNFSNKIAHYETTGPEIWEQTDGRVTHFVCGMGTCGTISGVSKFLKEQNKEIQAIGIDTYGSIFQKYKETGEIDSSEVYPYFTEGIGEDILPKNADFSLVDRIEKVSDRDAFRMTRKLARDEGLLLGGSCGSAVVGGLRVAEELGRDDVMVILLPDHGTRYLGKIFNEIWMRAHGFLEDEGDIVVQDILSARGGKQELIAIEPEMSIVDAIRLMKKHDVSQLPVMAGKKVVGGITESMVLDTIMERPGDQTLAIKEIMGKPFPMVSLTTQLRELRKMVTRQTPAVMVETREGNVVLITQYDLIQFFSA